MMGGYVCGETPILESATQAQRREGNASYRYWEEAGVHARWGFRSLWKRDPRLTVDSSGGGQHARHLPDGERIVWNPTDYM